MLPVFQVTEVTPTNSGPKVKVCRPGTVSVVRVAVGAVPLGFWPLKVTTAGLDTPSRPATKR